MLHLIFLFLLCFLGVPMDDKCFTIITRCTIFKQLPAYLVTGRCDPLLNMEDIKVNQKHNGSFLKRFFIQTIWPIHVHKLFSTEEHHLVAPNKIARQNFRGKLLKKKKNLYKRRSNAKHIFRHCLKIRQFKNITVCILLTVRCIVPISSVCVSRLCSMCHN